MFGAIIFLTALALAHGRPEIIRSSYPNLWEPSELCPPIHIHHLLPHENDCSKFYYCEYGLKRIDATNCAPGTLFSYEKQVCVHPWDADCNQPGPSQPVNTPAPPTDAPADITYPNLWEPSDLCPPIHEHHLIPHETDCSKFYYCEYGKKRIDATNCAPGTLFSYQEQVCVHPRDSDCNQQGPSQPVNTPAPSTDAPADITYPNLWEPSDLCPPIHEHHLIPHETDCSKFYYCEYGMKRIDATDCAPGTLFSYKEQVCVHPRDSDCNQPGPSQPVDTPAPSTDAPADITYPNLWEPSYLCPPIHEHHLIPHETDCSKFYYCEYGMKRIDATDCAPGTLFSYKEQVCVHPRDSDCNQPGPSQPVDTPAPPTGAPPTDAPAQTTYPNLWEPSDLCPPIHEHHLIPHETDCSKFYYCEYGMKRIDATDCAPGTLFSYKEQVCVHPRDSDCNLPGPTGSPNPSPTTIPTPGPSPTTTEDAPVTDPPTEAPITNPPPPPTEAPITNPPPPPTAAPVTNPPPSPSPTPTPEPDCDCEDGGNDCEVDYDARCRDNCNILPWAHATDCDKFWRCDGDKAVRVVCPEGLHFNPSTGNCDFMCNAGCVRRHTTTTTYSDGLKVFVPFSEINGASTGVESRIHRAIEHAKQR